RRRLLRRALAELPGRGDRGTAAARPHRAQHARPRPEAAPRRSKPPTPPGPPCRPRARRGRSRKGCRMDATEPTTRLDPPNDPAAQAGADAEPGAERDLAEDDLVEGGGV